ncbi:hypothetical protein BH11ARM1_BH11ARM1_07170 [soil metagenome]
MSGAADIAEETHDEELENMLGKVWRNATEKRIFVTGGIGPSASNEGFTVDYDLPNMTAYQETCASVAMALWGERMSRLNGDAQYEDTVEKALYNGMLSGVGLDGKSFFYTNPLASQGNHHRVEWFECACCPPNVLRTVASIGGFAYAKSKDALFVNLYMGGRVGTKVGSQSANWEVKTDYPWSGRVEMTAKASGVYDLMLRKPGWCPSASLSVDDKPVMGDAVQGYLQAGKVWKAGDKVVFDMQMPVQQVQANPMVKDDVNKSAIQRGPLIYCMEQVGNSAKVTDTILPLGTSFTTKFDPKLLGGVVAIQATGMQSASAEWNRDLYQPAPSATPVSVQLVPYGFWDNRGAGAMAVWMPTTPPTPRITGPEGKATVGMSFTSGNSQPWAINDGLEVKSSGEQPEALCHWWPHKGGSEWVSYTWKKPIWVSGSRLFWFDDTGRGECRLPESFKLQTLRGTDWVDVPCETKVAMNQWSELKFEPIQTSSLRILLNQQKDWASGIHEWKVIPFEK